MADSIPSQSSQDVLRSLDEQLKECTPLDELECPGEQGHGLDYAVRMEEAWKASAAHREELKELVAEKVCQLLQRKATKSFRIFSIGCGNGTFDIKMLQTITERFPDVKVSYTGMDIDKKSCEQARELLGAVKNVEVEIIAQDFQEVDFNIPPCDLVLAIHVFYYMRDITKALVNTKKFRKQDGHTLIAIEKTHSPEAHLYGRFWLHEHKWPLQFSDSIIETLATMGEKYEIELIEGLRDLTECFKDEFKEPRHKYILDFLTHARMDRYPPAVAQTCIDYLSSVAIGKPEHYKVPCNAVIIMSRN